VGNITSQFATHGYCANNHYMIRYDESKARQSNVDGTMHPNASGQQIYANQLSAAVRATFSPDPLPPDGGPAGRSAWGFSWSQGGSGTFTASDGYARNSLVTTGSSGNNITRFDVGFYRADFPKLGSYAGGNVQVTAYGWDNTRCKVAGFGPNGDTMQAYVLCFDPSGNLVDSAFTASFTSNFETASTQLGYLWADQPSATDYTVSGAYQYNSTGNTNSIHRWGVGQYTATLPGLSNNSFGGTAEVTAGGWGSEHCKVSSWGGETVNINCYDTYGNLADSVFSVRFGAAEPLNAPSYAYAWANEPSSALYTPATYYQRIQLTSSCHSPSGPVTIQRGGVGSYNVNVPSLNPAGSTVKVTAYGWTSDTCKVNGWWSNGVDGTQISVSCFDAQGQPVDSYFVVNYSTDQYEIC
jgi:hypothetical protein